MTLLKRLAHSFLGRPSLARKFSAASFPLVSPDKLIEEETLPFYEHEQYYPVHIGEVFQPRYQIIGKLGYGSYSTVWLCHDLIERRHAALKVSTYLQRFPQKQSQEFLIYNHLSKIKPSSHPDLKTDNLMLTIEDESMIKDFEISEKKNPSPRKVIDKARTIYTSRKFDKPKNGQWGYPVICDFGEARIGNIQETGPFIQPHIYRAPEVPFEMPWGPPIDIWNIGTLIWDLFEGRHLFNCLIDDEGNYDPFKHMAQIVGFLGPPPKEFISCSETTSQCFDPQGHWIGDVEVPQTSLEAVETRLEGKDKELFLQFIRSMLQWLPEKRKTAKELLDDPWLKTDV